jgi:trehalose 6-phosphate synthase/phosphatase
MSRLLIISNRLPFSLDASGPEPAIRQSSGGLVSALKGYFEQSGESRFTEKIWVGSCDFSEEDWNTNKDKLKGADFSIEPIFIEPDLYISYYNGFSNSTIWPLFHYFPSLTEFVKEDFDAYFKVNRLFADRIGELMLPDDVIWVHDYQLMILPQLIRKKNSSATIGFFLHIPFPSYEMLRLLPSEWKRIILQGLLGADLVGFHTYDYAQYFIQSIKMVLGLDNHYNNIHYFNRIIKTDLFPIGIDYNKFKRATEDAAIIQYKEELYKNFEGKKIIFSVDRLDYTKGLTYRLQGYENFLERYPEWREKVIFIFNIVPSRDNIPTYNERKRMIEEKVSTINGKYSTIHWQPIIYRYNHLEFNELSGLYQAANVALITPLRDGMNLVAKEYVASCKDGGVLILSELTGAASELNEACLVNPTDIEEMADTIASSLKMPIEEQVERMRVMQSRLADYDVLHWVNDFLDQLMSVKKEQDKLQAKLLDNKTEGTIKEGYRNAAKRLILLDYDGTLAPFTKIPSQAIPGKQVLKYLENLSADPKNYVVIISGRDANTLQNWMGHLPIAFVAEHGVFLKHKGGEWEAQTTLSSEWKEEVRPMLKSYVTRCAGSLIEEKENTLSWHYRNTHPGLGFVRSRELLNNLLQLTANTPIQVIDGNKVLEVRLTGVDKGVTAQKMINYYNPDFILCIGDDTTDEDMFKVVAGKGFTVRIGSGSTSANYNILTQGEVLPFLENVTEINVPGLVKQS